MIIREKLNTPYIKLDKERCKLTIIGKSYPEDAALFYTPLVEEIKTCKKDLKESKITIKIALEIMNSVSTKYLFQIIKDIYKSAKETEIKWYYEADDECMLEEGNIYKESFPDSKFKLLEVEDLRKI
jgi:hypothetical protein